MNLIHSSLIDRAGVVEDDPAGGTLVNQIEDGLTVVSSGAQMQPTEDVIISAHVHLSEIVIATRRGNQSL